MKTSTVTPAQRFQAHRLIKELRAERRYNEANVVDAAIIWECLPHNFTATQASLGASLLNCEPFSDNWFNIATTIQIIIDEQWNKTSQ